MEDEGKPRMCLLNKLALLSVDWVLFVVKKKEHPTHAVHNTGWHANEKKTEIRAQTSLLAPMDKNE